MDYDYSAQESIDCLRNSLKIQFIISWQMLEIHLEGLEDENAFGDLVLGDSV